MPESWFFMEKLNLPENRDNKFLIDWLSFTSKCDSDNSIFQLLGLEHIKQHFQHIYGFQGYRQRLYFDGISICYDGFSQKNGDMGICVEMSGKGLRNWEEYSSANYEKIFDLIRRNYHLEPVDTISAT